MKPDRFQELLSKLDNIHTDGISRLVSPIPDGAVKCPTSEFRINKNTKLNDLTHDQILLAHALLHRFYSQGEVQDLTREEIKELHDVISVKINHKRFDNLDD